MSEKQPNEKAEKDERSDEQKAVHTKRDEIDAALAADVKRTQEEAAGNG